MRRFLNLVLFNPVLWLSFGSILLLLGGVGLGDVPTISAQIRQARQLPDLVDARPGSVALFEGRISPETPLVYGEFVSYLQEQYQSCWDSSCWVETARETPPLWLTVGEQTVQIANQDYRLEATEHTLEEAAPTWTKGTLRSRGFRRGSPIVGIGEVAAQAGSRQVTAEFIWAGTRSGYLDHLEAYRRRSVWWGGGFLAGGLVLGAIGGGQLWRFVRSIQAEAAAQASAEPASHTTRKRRKQQRRERTDV